MAISSIDTNILLRIITRDDPKKRSQALDLLSEENHIFHIFTPALTETVYVLETLYNYSREDIVDKLSFFLARFSDSLVYDIHATKLAFPLYLEHPQLSFCDCMLSAYAEANNAEPLFTFDKALAKKSASAKLVS